MYEQQEFVRKVKPTNEKLESVRDRIIAIRKDW